MTTMEKVIDRQYELFGVIARAIENLHKLGPSRTNRGSMRSRMEALKANWEKFQLHHESLINACTAETKKLPYFSEALYSQCEEIFVDAHGIMLNLLDDFELKDRQQTPKIDASLGSSGSHSRRLPRIDLPKFSGDYAQWSHFRDLFASIVNENGDLSAVEKLHYLKMSLSEEPATLLTGVELSSEGFSRAWKILIARYDNTRILIDAQLSALFSIRRVKSECSSELKRLLCAEREALGALASLECPVHHWDLIIVFMMVRLLDSESLKDWEKALGAKSKPPTFAEFEEFISGRILTLEALERTMLPKKPPTPVTTRTPSGARAHNVVTPDQKCAFCSADHYISSCPQYLDKSMEHRREVVVSKRLCFNCLGPHLLKACRSPKRCRICRKQHHTTLHTAHDSLASVTRSGPSSILTSAPSAHYTEVNASIPQAASHNQD